MPSPSPDYDDTDWTDDEMLALAEQAFNAADAAGQILTDEDREDLALSRSPEFEFIRQRSQQSLEQEGGLPSDYVRRRLGLLP